MLLLLLSLFFITIHAYQKLINSRIVLLPGYGCCKNDYVEFQQICNHLNIPLDIVEIQRWEWLKVTKGIMNPNYWNYNCMPNELFDWYLEKTKNTLFSSFEKNEHYPVILCGHSAGGWLGRFLLNNGTLYGEETRSKDYVKALVTMGTPNQFLLKKENDTTRGCLQYVHEHFPNSYLQEEGIKYMTLGSRVKKINLQETLNWKEKMVRNSYLTVVDKHQYNEIWGDGVVPYDACHLERAKQVTFDDVYHFQRKNKKWYWEESILKKWLYELEKII